MYLKKIRLQNIKCFEDVTLEFPHQNGDYSGWNVILGENGLGKTAILQCIAMQLYNQPPISLSPASWLREQKGIISGVYTYQADQSQNVRHAQLGCKFVFPGRREIVSDISYQQRPQINGASQKADKRGWVAAGYGPFRRLSFDEHRETLQFADSRFVTLFYPFVGLSEPLNWLPRLYASSIDPKSKNRQAAGKLLDLAKDVINRLLPPTFRLDDVNTEDVLFSDESGRVKGDFMILSDGFKSFLALAGDLLEQIFDIANEIASETKVTPEGIEVHAEGIVLIDEADAHLHPSWQRELGERLRQVFPKIQFIVTTHSPFIAQEATDGGLFVLRRNDKGTVDVEQFEESVRGWTATQILTSPRLFGLHSTRAPKTEELIQESATLTAKEHAGKLTKKEKERLAEVRQKLTTAISAPGETYEEMLRQQDMARYVDETLHRLKNGKNGKK